MYGKEAKLCTKNLGYASLHAANIEAQLGFAGLSMAACLVVSRRLGRMYFGCRSAECMHSGRESQGVGSFVTIRNQLLLH
jgi:hypothetical protein